MDSIKLVRNILTTLLARIFLLALALISSVALARMLGPEGRGLFALVLLLPEWARSFGLLGFEQANAVYAGLEPERRRALVWQSVVIAVGVGGIIAAIGISLLAMGAPGFRDLVRGPLWLYLLPLSTVPARLLVEYWDAILRGMNRIILLNAVQVGMKVVSLVLVIVFVGWLRLEVAGAVYADFLISVGSVVLLVILLKHVGIWSKPSFDRALSGRTTRFALPAHGGTVAAYLNYRVDEFIIAALLPPEQLGFYVIAVGLVERLWILPGSVATALLPHLTNTKQRDPLLAADIARHVMVWTGGVCLLLYLEADVVVRVLYSSAFAASAPPLRWLLPGIFTLSVGKVLVAELLTREKPAYTVWASGIGALVNIIGNVLLLPRMGISGAALASSVSYSLISLLAIWFYLRETRMPWTALLPRPSDLLVYFTLWRRLNDVVPIKSGMTGGVRP